MVEETPIDVLNDVAKSELHVRAAKGIALTTVSQVAKLVISIASQLTLSRILLPKDFGIVAMAAPALAFIAIFNSLGLSAAVIQKSQITQRELNALYWMGLALSSLCALVAVALSPLVGAFYHQVQAGYVCAAIALQMPLGAFSGHAGALMSRRMQFGALAVIEVVSAIVGLVVGLICAFCGLRYWSLVIAQLSVSAISAIVEWFMSGWRPSRPAWTQSATPLVKFGINLTGFNILSTFSLYADNAVVGLLNGATVLGLFDKAFSLVLRPLGSITAPIGRVAIPLLSRIRDDEARYRQAYLSMLQSIVLIAAPGLLVGALMTGEVVRTLLGRNWEGSAPIMAWICVAAMFTPLSGSAGWLFTSQGRPNEQLKSGFVSSGLILVSMLAGLHWGPVGIAFSYAIFAPAVHGCFAWVATRRGPVSMSDIIVSILPIAVSLLLAVVPVFAIDATFHGPALIKIGAGLVAAYVVTAGVAFGFPQVRRSVAMLRNIRSSLV